VTDCRMYIRAAVVEPVGRKAYWSLKSSAGGGVKSAGCRNSLTTIRSIIPVRNDAMDIDR